MSAPRVSDHALVRFLERAGGLDVEALRHAIGRSLGRAHEAAESLGATDYRIKVDGLCFLVREGLVVTVLPDRDTARRGAMRKAKAE